MEKLDTSQALLYVTDDIRHLHNNIAKVLLQYSALQTGDVARDKDSSSEAPRPCLQQLAGRLQVWDTINCPDTYYALNSCDHMYVSGHNNARLINGHGLTHDTHQFTPAATEQSAPKREREDQTAALHAHAGK